MSGDSNIDVITSGPAPGRRRPSQRRVVLIVAAVLLLAGAAVYGLDARRRATDVTVDTPAVAGLRSLGDPVPINDGTELEAASAFVVGDRAIAIGEASDVTWIAGMDLLTGKPAWPPRSLPHTGIRNVDVLPQGIVVVFDELGENWLMVLDPTTGRPRWQAVVDPPMLAYRDVIVVGDSARDMLRGLDWDTGQPRWLIPMRATSAYTRALPTAGPVTAALRTAPELADDRVFEIGTDGSVTVYDARTGDRTGIHAGALPARVGSEWLDFWVYGDLLLELRHEANQVIGYDLGADGGSRTIYTAPGPERVVLVAACGTSRICVNTEDGDLHALVFVDAATAQVLWIRSTNGIGSGATSNRIVTAGTDMFDPDGRPLLAAPNSAVGWINPTSLLILASSYDGWDVFIVNAINGAKNRIGAIGQPDGGCAMDARTLVCPVGGRLRAWRFA